MWTSCKATGPHGVAFTSECLHVDLEALTILACEERVRLIVTDDRTFDWVPCEWAVQTHCDIGEMADLQHSVVCPHI